MTACAHRAAFREISVILLTLMLRRLYTMRMDITVAHVRQLANAYRETMIAGKEKFPKESADEYVLLAIVAASASDSFSWITKQVPNGDLVSAPLKDLASELQKDDKLGKTLQAIQTAVMKKARSAISSLAFTGTRPLWLSSIVTFFTGIFAYAQNVGAIVGSVIIPAIVAGGPALYAVIRTLGYSKALVSHGTASLLASAQTLGSQPEALFRKTAGPTLDSLFKGSAGPQVAGPQDPAPVVRDLRRLATGIVGLAYVVLAIVLIFFAFGVSDAFTVYTNSPGCKMFCTPPTPTVPALPTFP